jgi:hypothetical protein
MPPSLIEAAAWACALATVFWQRLLLPSCLLAWDLLVSRRDPADPPVTITAWDHEEDPASLWSNLPPTQLGGAALRSSSSGPLPQRLESLTRRQLQQLAGTKSNLTKAELLRRIRADMDSAWTRYAKVQGLPAPGTTTFPGPVTYKPASSCVQPVPLR